MGPVAPAIVLWSKLNMKLVCKCNSHSVFVGFPCFILILHPKIDFFICCSVYSLNLMLFSSFIWFVWSGLFEAEGFSCVAFVRSFLLFVMFFILHLYPQWKESVLILLLSNVWVGDAFKLLTVITYTHACAHTRKLTHRMTAASCVCMWALSHTHTLCVYWTRVCVCTVHVGVAWLNRRVQNNWGMGWRCNNR